MRSGASGASLLLWVLMALLDFLEIRATIPVEQTSHMNRDTSDATPYPKQQQGSNRLL